MSSATELQVEAEVSCVEWWESSSCHPVFRARRVLRAAGVPRALTGGRGRQSAGGRVPAPGLRRRIGEARGPGWEAGLPRGRGGGGAAPSQQPASAERAARRVDKEGFCGLLSLVRTCRPSCHSLHQL